MTEPSGKSTRVQTVDKDDLFVTGQYDCWSTQDWQIGKYVITFKSFATEQVVCRKDIIFSLDKLAIENMKLNFEAVNPNFIGNPSRRGMHLKSVDLNIAKKGNLPILFKSCSLKFDGKHMDGEIKSGRLMMDQILVVNFHPWSGQLFEPGTRGKMEVKLLFGEKQSIDFEKEVIIQGIDFELTFADPERATSIKQGHSHTMDLRVNRGKDIKEIALKAEAAQGITAALYPDKLGDKKTEARLTIEIPKGTKPGDYIVIVTATPEPGKPATTKIAVKVVGDAPAKKDNALSVGPDAAVTVKQGEKETATLKVALGKDLGRKRGHSRIPLGLCCPPPRGLGLRSPPVFASP